MATFLDYYRTQIQPHIEAADIFFKTEPEPYTNEQVSSVFQLPKTTQNIWTKVHIMEQLKESKSIFGKCFARELYCGIPTQYTTAQISYIYDIALEVVEQAAKETGLSSCPRSLLPVLFSAIELNQTQYLL